MTYVEAVQIIRRRRGIAVADLLRDAGLSVATLYGPGALAGRTTTATKTKLAVALGYSSPAHLLRAARRMEASR